MLIANLLDWWCHQEKKHKLERLVWSDKGSRVILIYIIAGQLVATVANKYLDSTWSNFTLFI